MIATLFVACVMDRTGQSAPATLQKAVVEHDRRLMELEAVSEDQSRRVGQLEEVTRARGADDILKLETMEQLRQEVARSRGDLEVLRHDYDTFESSGLGFQTDSDWRMRYLDVRIGSLEKSLGLKAPPPPSKDGEPVAEVDPVVPPPDAAGTPPLPDLPVAATADDAFALTAAALTEGKNAVARAIMKRFIDENPKHDRVAEAHYRIAEAFQNEDDHKNAATAFDVVVKNHAESTWAPWSMLRQGECFAALGKPDVAKIFWEDVVKKYPKSKAAKEAKEHLAGR